MSDSIEEVEIKEEEEDISDSVAVTVTDTDASQHCICPYEKGENVIASFSNHFYHAKVVKVKFEEDWRFLIHYWRWKKRWDEWVGVDRLLKSTEENLNRVLQDDKIVTDVKTGRLSLTKFGTDTDLRGKKQRNDSTLVCLKRKREHNMVQLDEKDDGPIEKVINISVSAKLKKQLVDDFELIKRMGMLVKLPRTPNVDDIIQKYQEYKRKDDLNSASLGEVLSGLCAYFNKALPIMLLYNEERQQYQEVIRDNMFPSTVYGAEHLLRLFVKLPELIYDLKIEKETLQDLKQNLHDFLNFKSCEIFKLK